MSLYKHTSLDKKLITQTHQKGFQKVENNKLGSKIRYESPW